MHKTNGVLRGTQTMETLVTEHEKRVNEMQERIHKTQDEMLKNLIEINGLREYLDEKHLIVGENRYHYEKIRLSIIDKVIHVYEFEEEVYYGNIKDAMNDSLISLLTEYFGFKTWYIRNKQTKDKYTIMSINEDVLYLNTVCIDGEFDYGVRCKSNIITMTDELTQHYQNKLKDMKEVLEDVMERRLRIIQRIIYENGLYGVLNVFDENITYMDYVESKKTQDIVYKTIKIEDALLEIDEKQLFVYDKNNTETHIGIIDDINVINSLMTILTKYCGFDEEPLTQLYYKIK